MPQKSFLIALIIATLSLACANPGSSPTTNEKKATTPPNIIFILADDHRWDLIGKYHPIIKTPNLDALANKGTVFKNAFVTTPICATSRASLLTGLTESTHQFTFRKPPIAQKYIDQSYPKLLKHAGYYSAFVGKLGVKVPNGNDELFHAHDELSQSLTNTFNGEALPQTDYIAAKSSQFIKNASSENKPFVLSVSFWNPHAHDRDTEDQYHYPEVFDDWYQDLTIPEAPASSDADFAALPKFLQQSMGRKRWEYRFGSPEIYQKMVKRHYRAIGAVDRAVGRIYQQLEDLGIADNTVIIYTGDNGYSMNQRQLAGKWFGWEEDLRVPLIIYDPRQSKAQEIEQTVLNIDIPSTIMALAGEPIPNQYQGLNLLILVNKPTTQDWREEFFFEHSYNPRGLIPPNQGVRTAEYKYVVFPEHGGYEQLYHLPSDPWEQNNLSSTPEYAKVKEQLKSKTDDYSKYYKSLR